MEALVGIGGPVLGSLGALVCLVVGWLTDSLFWYSLASTGFLINLFNLIPVSPLDGGRIVGVISRWLWAADYAVGIVVSVSRWGWPTSVCRPSSPSEYRRRIARSRA